MPMIDDYAKAEELIRKLEAGLPIPARPTSTLIRLLRQQGVKLARNQELSIRRLFYMGDEGGISCDVTPPGMEKTPIICSITQVEISPEHPLAGEIQNYQRERMGKVRRAGGAPVGFSVEPRRKRRRRQRR
jgi:hypothetical protein